MHAIGVIVGASLLASSVIVIVLHFALKLFRPEAFHDTLAEAQAVRLNVVIPDVPQAQPRFWGGGELGQLAPSYEHVQSTLSPVLAPVSHASTAQGARTHEEYPFGVLPQIARQQGFAGALNANLRNPGR